MPLILVLSGFVGSLFTVLDALLFGFDVGRAFLGYFGTVAMSVLAFSVAGYTYEVSIRRRPQPGR